MGIKWFSSIGFKIIFLITLILITTGVFVVYFVNITSRTNLLKSTDRYIYQNTETLITTMKNMMLDGRAPLLVSTMSDLRDLNLYRNIAIYRINGDLAFSDFKTIVNVNNNQ